MAIYDRSNIDYSGMIRDMINARTAGAKIAADNIRRQGELWGNFAKDIGGVASRTWDSAHLDDTDMPGIANYVAFGDSSLLDRQLAEAAARRQMAEQQAFQANESDLNRALQERIARMNRTSANEDKREEARLQMQRLILQRSKMQEQGMNTGDLDLQIKHLADKYDFETAPEVEYDINKDPEYVLAKYDDLDYTDDTAEGSHLLEDARNELINFRTPAAVKRIAKLDKEIKKRDNYRKNKAAVDAAIQEYWNKGVMPDLLLQLGFEEGGVSGDRFLTSGKKIYRRPGKKPAKPTSGPINN